MATLINNAYQCLSHPRKRTEYDCLLSLKQSKRTLSTGSPKSRSSTRGDSVMATDFTQSEGDIGRPRHCPVCGKFSCTGGHSGFPQNDRRASNRLKQQGTVSYTLPLSNNHYQAELMNLSPKGMQFISKKAIDPHTKIKFGCALLFGTAKVTHARKVLMENQPLYIKGLKFIMVEFYKSCGTFLSVKV